MQSVLEGIAFRAAEVITAMNEFTPITKTISIDGGLSTNPYFCQFLSNLLQRNIRVQKFAELTAVGTAALAGGYSAQVQGENQTGVVYPPSKDMTQYIDKFKQAVDRSIQWRSN